VPIWPKFSRFWLAQSMRDSEEARVAFRTDLREQLAVLAELTLDLRWTWSHSGDALEIVSPSASERVVRFGGPVAEILRDADAFAADLIAVTTEGRNALGCVVLGSVAEEVVRKAVGRGSRMRPPLPSWGATDPGRGDIGSPSV